MFSKKYALLAIFSLLLTSCGNGGSVSVTETQEVPQSPGKVWQKIGAFNDLGRWHPAVARTEMSPDGSVRTLFLKGGGTINERLVDYSDGSFYEYEIIDGVLPVMNYVSTVAIEPSDNGTMVTWSSTFDPAEGTTADKAEEVIRGVYRAGLDNLR